MWFEGDLLRLVHVSEEFKDRSTLGIVLDTVSIVIWLLSSFVCSFLWQICIIITKCHCIHGVCGRSSSTSQH